MAQSALRSYSSLPDSWRAPPVQRPDEFQGPVSSTHSTRDEFPSLRVRRLPKATSIVRPDALVIATFLFSFTRGHYLKMPLMKSLGGSVRSFFGVLDKATEEKLDIAIELATQASEQYDEYSATTNVDCLHISINLSQEAVDTIDKGHSMQVFERTDILGEFVHDALRAQCVTLRALFYETDDVKYLEQCIGTLRLLQTHAPKSSRYYVLEAELLSRAYLDRYFTTGEKNEKDAQDGIAAARTALSIPTKFKHKSNFVSSEDDDMLKSTLHDAKSRVDTPLAIHKGIFLYSRGGSMMRRYHRERNVEKLRSARLCLAQAVQLLPTGHEKHGRAVVEFADCEVLYIENTGDTTGLDSVVELFDSLNVSNALGEPGSDDHIKATTTKSLLFRTKFDHISDYTNLDQAVQAAHLATRSCRARTRLHVIAWENYSNQLARRAEVRQSIDDIDAAIEAANVALGMCPNENVRLRSQIYATVGRRLGDKWSLFGGSNNLSAAVEPLRNAVAVLPKNHGYRALHLHNLAHILRDVYLESGSIKPLEESIQVEREALSLVSQDDSQKYVMLDGLGQSLSQRFARLQHSEDLQEAIQVSEDSLAGTSKGSTLYPTRLHSLGLVLYTRFMRQLNEQDIDRAIELVSEAIACGGSNKTFALIYTLQLSSCHEQKYRVSENVQDLDLAIKLRREGLEKANVSHPLRDRWKMDLGVILDKRFKCTTEVEEKKRYLSEALSIQEECVKRFPDGHPDLVWYLCTLGNYRVHLNDVVEESDRAQRKLNFQSAISAYEQGYKQVYATPASRIRCGMLAGSCYIALHDWKAASKILSESINMFRRISPLALGENDRQQRLRGLTGMSTDACIAYIMTGDPEAGISILEAGRGIMSNIAMKQHDNLDDLKNVSPSLHTQYIALRHTLSLPVPTEKTQGQDAVAKRTQDQVKFEEIEDSIRHLPGLEDFNQSMSAQQIRQLAGRGPLVSFCVDDNRAFAVIVTKNAIESLPLPSLLPDDVRDMIPLVIGGTRLSLWRPSLRAKANTKMRKLLAWLWDTAVRPVLSHLNLLQQGPQDHQPRLWWVTSGTLGLMPLHAAGKGSKEPLENTYSHVVSSYASTFSALSFARGCQSRALSKRTGIPNVTLVTMPHTPARSSLATEPEAEAIREAFKVSIADKERLFELCQPMAEEVQRRVRGSDVDIFHYSGHAEADLKDPSKSALLFGSDPAAPVPDPLPIESLRKYDGGMNAESQTPQLAYLSACCTAQQNELKLLDENIHLAAIFQAMGFPAVIGTLWEADDKAATFIAKVFYQKLLAMSNTDPGAETNVSREDHVVRALHAATSACRAAKFGKADGGKDVLLWANFVHFGA